MKIQGVVLGVVTPCMVKMELARSSETLASYHITTRHHDPPYHDLNTSIVFENSVLRRIFGPKREEVTGKGKKIT